jgi:hypothetical protein
MAGLAIGGYQWKMNNDVVSTPVLAREQGRREPRPLCPPNLPARPLAGWTSQALATQMNPRKNSLARLPLQGSSRFAVQSLGSAALFSRLVQPG